MHAIFNLKRLNRILAAGLCTILLAVQLSACKSPPKLYQMEYSGYLDTVSQFTMPSESEAAFMDQANYFEERLAFYHQRFTSFEPVSGITNIWTLNQSAGENPVEVTQEIMDLLVFSQGLSEETNGAVNVTMGAVTSLWKHAQDGYSYETETPAAPSAEAIGEALQHTNASDLVLNPDRLTVYFTDPELQLDVGAFAKGFTAEMLANELEGRGVTSALINLGGNVRTIGDKKLETNTPWAIGIQNPARRLEEAVLAYPGWIESQLPDETDSGGEGTEALTEGSAVPDPVPLPNLIYPTGSDSEEPGTGQPEDGTTENLPTDPSEADTDSDNRVSSEQDYLAVLNSVSSSLVTSGIYERFFIEDENLYHHIIDPDTGMPAQSFQSVSVVVPHSGRADALSTALFNMTLEEGVRFVENHENLEAVWVDLDGFITMSSGFGDLMRTDTAPAAGTAPE